MTANVLVGRLSVLLQQNIWEAEAALSGREGACDAGSFAPPLLILPQCPTSPPSTLLITWERPHQIAGA